jgi:hypothetical protein
VEEILEMVEVKEMKDWSRPTTDKNQYVFIHSNYALIIQNLDKSIVWVLSSAATSMSKSRGVDGHHHDSSRSGQSE